MSCAKSDPALRQLLRAFSDQTHSECDFSSVNWNLIKNHSHPLFHDECISTFSVTIRAKLINFISNFSLPFQMSGAAIIGLSVGSLLYKHQYVALLASSNYQFCTYALLLAGIGAVMSGIIGCCGVKRENFAIILIVSST